MKIFLLLLSVIPAAIFGQSNADSLKYEIIKLSVNFLATDSKVSATNQKASCKYQDYECLKKFCDESKILKAAEKVDVWKKTEVKSASDLKKLADKIIIELTSSTVKEYRKSLPSFKPFIEQLAKLTTMPSMVSNGDTIVTNKKNPIPINEKSLSKNGQVDDSTQESSNIPELALILSIIGVILSIYFFINRRAKAKKDSIVVNSKLEAVLTDINGLRSKINNSPSDEQYKSLVAKINTLERELTELYTLQKDGNTIINETSKKNMPKVLPIFEGTVFAKIPDLTNGFSLSIISDSQNGEQIYEINITGDSAKYFVSKDVNAQKYAMSDFNYYLSNACDFLNQPIKNCKINTIEYGVLNKISDNWIIQDKAKIEFK